MRGAKAHEATVKELAHASAIDAPAATVAINDLEGRGLLSGTIVHVEVRDPVGPDGIDWVRNICASRGLASTSTLASTQEPAPSTASFSSTGDNCLHGPHHSAQKSTTTGTS